VTGVQTCALPILLNQNYSVLKALFADYNTELGGTDADRATSMGRLGMAMGNIHCNNMSLSFT
jgi:hypothetical protein